MIIFSHHALLKLQQRGIKSELVEKTIESPDSVMQTYQDRQAAFKKFGKLYLKVVFKKENKNIIVITQHWVGRIGL